MDAVIICNYKKLIYYNYYIYFDLIQLIQINIINITKKWEHVDFMDLDIKKSII